MDQVLEGDLMTPLDCRIQHFKAHLLELAQESDEWSQHLELTPWVEEGVLSVEKEEIVSRIREAELKLKKRRNDEERQDQHGSSEGQRVCDKGKTPIDRDKRVRPRIKQGVRRRA